MEVVETYGGTYMDVPWAGPCGHHSHEAYGSNLMREVMRATQVSLLV